MLKINQVYRGDCLDVMNQIDDKSIDMILCDLPYGTTACKWDVVIPFEPLWEHYKRIIKDNGAIVLTATEPFASYLRMSNIKWYKYDWIWNKPRGHGYQVVKYRPLMSHENIIVFSNGKINYHPQMVRKKFPRLMTNAGTTRQMIVSNNKPYKAKKPNTHSYPVSSLFYSNEDNKNKLHPTQKPVALFEYLIKTYTNENDLVLDNCAGGGTTGIAARNLNRNFILIEKELEYVELIQRRLNEPYQKRLINE